MSEGLPGREMFMLLSGEVEVSVGQRTRRRLGFLSEGSFFGENPVLAVRSKYPPIDFLESLGIPR